jgi:hypothetical protein
MKKLVFFPLLLLKWALFSQTVGLINYQNGNTPGYVLFSPTTSTATYLIDKCGNKVHEWNSTYRPALASYLLEDGSLLRTGQLDNANFDEGGSGGIIEKFDWDGNLTWSYSISDNFQCQHHDVKFLPNGNVLAIVWERFTAAEIIAEGKNSSYANSYILTEKIVELQPSGLSGATIVWEWKVMDHLIQDFDNTKPNFGVVANNPSLINLNYFPGLSTNVDWIHLNSIDYNEALDQIIVSSHTFCEFWIIDHSTTTAQAATNSGGNSGIGGNLMYRWGNPQAYGRGNPSVKKFYGQHHATWIPAGMPNAGKILVFNNGLNRPAGVYSSVDMVETPAMVNNTYPIVGNSAFAPTSLFWTYTAPVPTDFYSSNISGVYPLENGSFMVTSGASGKFFEINSNNEEVWEYISPSNNTGIITQGNVPSGNLVFRCNFYPENYDAFSGKTLVDLGEIEINPTSPSICEVYLGIDSKEISSNEFSIVPNPSSDVITITNFQSIKNIEILNSLGKIVLTSESASFSISYLTMGTYFVKVNTVDNSSVLKKLVKN